MAIARLLTNESEGPCALLLRDGLYEYLTITKTSNFTEDLRSYFLSDTFKNDVKTGKWSAGIDVIIEGVPVNFNASNFDSQMTKYKQKIVASTSLQLAQSTYDQVVSKIPNVDLAREYTKCIGDTRGFGFKVLGETVSDTSVVLTISYRLRLSSDPMPHVIEADVIGGVDIKGLPSVGSVIQDEFVITFIRNPALDAIVIINTDREAFTYPIPKYFGAQEAGVPVGTIIASNLTFDQFRTATKDDKIAGPSWSPQKSKWSPCDGRQVPDSDYVDFAQRYDVPDLRGVFLRGLNVLDSNPSPTSPALDNTRVDPDNRIVGSFQGDDIKEHNHTMALRSSNANFGNGQYTGLAEPQTPNPPGWPAVEIHPTGGKETRPKNVAVYYYIRIN